MLYSSAKSLIDNDHLEATAASVKMDGLDGSENFLEQGMFKRTTPR